MYVRASQLAHRRVLPDVHARAHRALPVHEERERERQVVGGVRRGRGRRLLVECRPGRLGRARRLPRPRVRLHEPLAEPDEIARKQASLDQVVQRLKQQRSALVAQATLPRALLAI